LKFVLDESICNLWVQSLGKMMACVFLLSFLFGSQLEG